MSNISQLTLRTPALNDLIEIETAAGQEGHITLQSLRALILESELDFALATQANMPNGVLTNAATWIVPAGTLTGDRQLEFQIRFARLGGLTTQAFPCAMTINALAVGTIPLSEIRVGGGNITVLRGLISRVSATQVSVAFYEDSYGRRDTSGTTDIENELNEARALHQELVVLDIDANALTIAIDVTPATVDMTRLYSRLTLI